MMNKIFRLGCVAFLAFGAEFMAAQSFNIQTIDTGLTSNDGYARAGVAVAAGNLVGVIYQTTDTGAGTSSVRFASGYAGQTFAVETIQAVNTSYGLTDTQLAASSAGFSASYWRLNTGLIYASRTGGSWSTELVNSEGSFNRQDIAFNSSGTPSIVYSRGTTPDPLFTTRTGGAWSSGTSVASGPNVGGVFPALVFSGDTPIVAYHTNGGGAGMFVRSFSGGTWNTLFADNSGDFASADMAVDASGALHLIYKGNGNSILRYATNASGSWVADTIATNSGSDTTAAVSIAVNPNGGVGITYTSSFSVIYGSSEGGDWNFQTIGSGVQGTLSYLDDGRAAIAYYSTFSNSQLNLAISAVPEPATLTLSMGVGAVLAIAVRRRARGRTGCGG